MALAWDAKPVKFSTSQNRIQTSRSIPFSENPSLGIGLLLLVEIHPERVSDPLALAQPVTISLNDAASSPSSSAVVTGTRTS